MTEESKEKNLPAVKEKVDLTSGIVPKDFDELNRFAELVNRAGLSPKSFDTVAKVAIGMLTNMELGRPIITGLQDLAIINGRCGIYGDASLAMVTASGLMDNGYPVEVETGTPFEDDWTFTFKIKRKGGPERIGKWTWAESKRAGFDNPMQRDGKPDRFSPWRRFTRRMMQWKARNYIMRDVFGDVLKGMKTVEDLHDLDGVVELQETKSGTFEKSESKKDLEAKILEDITAIEKQVRDSGAAVSNAVKSLVVKDPEKSERILEAKNDEPDHVDKVENIKNWKWLKTPGFERFVASHKDEIKAAPTHIKVFMRQKWVDGCKLDPDIWDGIFGGETDAKNDTESAEIENMKTSQSDSMEGMAEDKNSQSGSTVEVSVSEMPEWTKLIELQKKYPEIYQEKIGQGVFKTIEDVGEAIAIIEEAVADIEFDMGGSLQ